MPFKRTIEIGRVALCNYGADAGKLYVIVDVLDTARVRLRAVCRSSQMALRESRAACSTWTRRELSSFNPTMPI